MLTFQEKSVKTVILGGGPSGLGVAWGLMEQGYSDILLVEKNPRLGGLSGSFKVRDCTVDFGPHRFSPEFPDLVEKLQGLLGPEFLRVPNKHAVVFNRRIYRYPPVLIDFLNPSTLLISARVIASWLKPGPFSQVKQDTFEQRIIDGFGKTFYESVIRPMCFKIWGDPATLDPGFASLRFSVPTFVQWFKKMVGHTDTFNDRVFYYPRLGFQQLWDSIGAHLKSRGVQILNEATATSIELRGARVTSVVISQNGTQRIIEPDWLVSTIPTQHFMRVLRPNPFSASELLSQRFENRGMILALFLVKREKTLPARVIIFPQADQLFNRLFEQNQFSRDTVPAEKSLVVADIITDIQAEIWRESDGALCERVRRQISECGLVKSSEVEWSEIIRVPMAYPLPTVVRETAQAEFNDRISRFENVICTGRFASSDYNNSHTALKKGWLASETIAKKEAPAAWYSSTEKLRKTAIRD